MGFWTCCFVPSNASSVSTALVVSTQGPSAGVEVRHKAANKGGSTESNVCELGRSLTPALPKLCCLVELLSKQLLQQKTPLRSLGNSLRQINSTFSASFSSIRLLPRSPESYSFLLLKKSVQRQKFLVELVKFSESDTLAGRLVHSGEDALVWYSSSKEFDIKETAYFNSEQDEKRCKVVVGVPVLSQSACVGVLSMGFEALESVVGTEECICCLKVVAAHVASMVTQDALSTLQTLANKFAYKAHAQAPPLHAGPSVQSLTSITECHSSLQSASTTVTDWTTHQSDLVHTSCDTCAGGGSKSPLCHSLSCFAATPSSVDLLVIQLLEGLPMLTKLPHQPPQSSPPTSQHSGTWLCYRLALLDQGKKLVTLITLQEGPAADQACQHGSRQLLTSTSFSRKQHSTPGYGSAEVVRIVLPVNDTLSHKALSTSNLVVVHDVQRQLTQTARVHPDILMNQASRPADSVVAVPLKSQGASYGVILALCTGPCDLDLLALHLADASDVLAVALWHALQAAPDYQAIQDPLTDLEATLSGSFAAASAGPITSDGSLVFSLSQATSSFSGPPSYPPSPAGPLAPPTFPTPPPSQLQISSKPGLFKASPPPHQLTPPPSHASHTNQKVNAAATTASAPPSPTGSSPPRNPPGGEGSRGAGSGIVGIPGALCQQLSPGVPATDCVRSSPPPSPRHKSVLVPSMVKLLQQRGSVGRRSWNPEADRGSAGLGRERSFSMEVESRSGSMTGALVTGLTQQLNLHRMSFCLEQNMPQSRVDSITALRLSKVLGKGAFATVFKATYRGLPAAAKVVRDDGSSGKHSVKHAHEIAVLSSLSHPGVIQAYCSFTDVVVEELMLHCIPASDGGQACAAALRNMTTDASAMCHVQVLEYCELGCLANVLTHCHHVTVTPGSSDPVTDAQASSPKPSHLCAAAPSLKATASAAAPPPTATAPPTAPAAAAATPAAATPAAVNAVQPPPDGCQMLSLRRLTLTLVQLASSVAYLHHMGVVHCDLKPANILLHSAPGDSVRGFTVKLADFGLCRLTNDEAGPEACTEGGGFSVNSCGTAPFVAPEALTLNGKVNFAVDVYAFGIIMWQLFTGHWPYENMDTREVVTKVYHQGMRPAFPSTTPPLYRELAESCWVAQPSWRPSFSLIIERLQEMLTMVESGLIPDLYHFSFAPTEPLWHLNAPVKRPSKLRRGSRGGEVQGVQAATT